jgi:6-phosphofructokinase
VVLAEGSPSCCPRTTSSHLPRDEHGHISLGRIDLGKFVAGKVAERYEQRTGRRKKVTGVQLGYESRCAPPHAFDVMLGSQLGIGAYRALVEEGLDGHMVSVSGQLDLQYVPFNELVIRRPSRPRCASSSTVAATSTASPASSRPASTRSATGRPAVARRSNTPFRAPPTPRTPLM